MTEREYDHLLDAVQDAINPACNDLILLDLADLPAAANDNSVEWPLTPFPDGWHASP